MLIQTRRSRNFYDDPYSSNVVMLLHCNGADGSNLIVDERGHAITVNGSANITTAQSKFGGTSLRFDGASSIASPASADFDFGTADFTIEMWRYLTSMSGASYYNHYFSIGGQGNFGFKSWPASTYFYANSNTQVSDNTPTVLNTWQHIALVRNGTSICLFLDGVLKNVNSINPNTEFGSATLPVNIGNGHPGEFLGGYLDEVRVTKGIGRYKASFNVQTSAFPNPDPFYDQTVVALRFEGINGATDVVDTSKYKNPVNNSTNAVTTSTTAFKYGTSSGYFVRALGQQLVIPYTTNFDVGTGDFTYEAWIRTSLKVTYQTVFGHYTGTGGGPWIQLDVNGHLWGGTTGSGYLISSAQVCDGVWHHVALSRGSGTLRLFADGTLVGQQANTTNCTLGLPIQVGEISSYSRFFDGYIDDFRYTRACRYTDNFTPSGI